MRYFFFILFPCNDYKLFRLWQLPAPNKGRRVDDTSSKSSQVEIVMYKDVLSLRVNDFFDKYSSKKDERSKVFNLLINMHLLSSCPRRSID